MLRQAYYILVFFWIRRPPLQAGSSLKLPTGQFLNGRPGSRPDGTTEDAGTLAGISFWPGRSRSLPVRSLKGEGGRPDGTTEDAGTLAGISFWPGRSRSLPVRSLKGEGGRPDGIAIKPATSAGFFIH